jgi:GntR family transcriptional repressor for pyruvate dehydrogenase complex
MTHEKFTAEMHRKIYRAIRARKPQEAHDLMEEHLRMAQAARRLERPAGRKTAAAAHRASSDLR